MNVIALLSFFDERPDWLAACVASLSRCCGHVVALDGAYPHFPQARPHSGDICAGAVIGTAQSLGIGVTYQADGLMSEVEKRNRLFELGRTVAEEGDWFLVADADMLVRAVPSDFRSRLERTEHHVGTYWITEAFEGGSGRYPARFLFESDPSLRLETTHFGYRRGSESLWETGGLPACETDLVLEHRRDQRHSGREARAAEYYRRRDLYGLELAEEQADAPVPQKA